MPMNKKLLIIASLGVLLFVPATQHQLFGADSSNLKVEITQNTQSDEQITQGVKAAFAKDFAKADVQVGTKDGVVTLTGFVADAKAKTDLGNAAKNILGVKNVVNSLEVKAAVPAK